MNADVSSHDIESCLGVMAKELLARMASEPVLVGIHTGGVWVARRLRNLMGVSGETAELDISFHRDDFEEIGVHPGVQPTTLAGGIDDRHVILVDDVLHTGRTIRAALDELFDYGRPASVTLAVLVDRGGRELPIQADVVGMQVDVRANQKIKLDGPDPLILTSKVTKAA